MFAAGMTLLWVVYRWQSWHTVNRFLLLITAAPFLVLFLLSIAPWLPSSWPFVDRLQSFLNLSSDATFSARLSDWSLALRDWLQQPLTGWGPGSFYDLHGELRAHPAWISNLSIRLLQETGLIGAAAFVCFALALGAGRINRPMASGLAPVGCMQACLLRAAMCSGLMSKRRSYEASATRSVSPQFQRVVRIGCGALESGAQARSIPLPACRPYPHRYLLRGLIGAGVAAGRDRAS